MSRHHKEQRKYRNSCISQIYWIRLARERMESFHSLLDKRSEAILSKDWYQKLTAYNKGYVDAKIDDVLHRQDDLTWINVLNVPEVDLHVAIITIGATEKQLPCRDIHRLLCGDEFRGMYVYTASLPEDVVPGTFFNVPDTMKFYH